MLTIVPVRFVRAMGADLIIAIDIYCGKPPALRGIVLKTFRLQSWLFSETETAEADILIRPAFEPDNPVSFSRRDEAIMAGYHAAADAIPEIKAKIAAWQTRPKRSGISARRQAVSAAGRTHPPVVGWCAWTE